MDTLKQRRQQLLDDTIYYYSLFPRCLKYNSEEGYAYPVFSGTTAGLNTAGDVLGRLLTPLHRDTIDAIWGEEVPLEDVWGDLPQEVLSLGRKFLTEVCLLHDDCIYWKDKTLSKYGEEFVEEIKTKFIN